MKELEEMGLIIYTMVVNLKKARFYFSVRSTLTTVDPLQISALIWKTISMLLLTEIVGAIFCHLRSGVRDGHTNDQTVHRSEILYMQA